MNLKEIYVSLEVNSDEIKISWSLIDNMHVIKYFACILDRREDIPSIYASNANGIAGIQTNTSQEEVVPLLEPGRKILVRKSLFDPRSLRINLDS